MLEQALAINVGKFGEDSEQALRSKSSLAVLLFDTREYEQAETLLRGLIETQSRVIGENNPSTIESKANLAALLDKLERYDEEEVLLLDVLERRRKTMGADNPETLRSLREVVKIYADTDRVEKARPLLEELIAARRRAADAPEAAPNDLDECALILIESPIPELRDFKRALECAKKANDLTDNEQPTFLHTLAQAQFANGDKAAAIETLHKALGLLPPEAPERVKLQEHLDQYEAH